MITKVDWVSFSFPVGHGEAIAPHHLLETILGDFYDFAPTAFNEITKGYEWEQRKGRAPYSVGFIRSDNGCSLFAHPNLSHALVELTGRGCESAATLGTLNLILGETASRLTRIDIASDMLTETSPLTFAPLRDAKRFKSHSEFVSESGTTCYVGSRTSDRYARVYRYNAPHERAHLLRCEHVLKAEQARSTALAVIHDGLQAVAKTLGEAFGWSHTDWEPDSDASAEIPVWRPERKEGKTLFWLNDTVAKTLIRLHKEGVLDATQWLRHNVLSQLDLDDDNLSAMYTNS
jgi:hypothetical protein